MIFEQILRLELRILGFESLNFLRIFLIKFKVVYLGVLGFWGCGEIYLVKILYGNQEDFVFR